MKIPFFTPTQAAASIRNKKAILTYHRIFGEEKGRARTAPEVDQFYDLPMSVFRRQMDRVASHAQAYDAGAPIPCLELTFDDGTNDHLSAATVLADLGLSGIFFIITGRIGTSGYLSKSDIRILLHHRQRIGIRHTVTHRRLSTLTDVELRLELEQSRDVLHQLTGHEVDWFAPPGEFRG